jgi:microcystin-dependent protein
VALETATYVPELVSSNPGHTDGLTQADSHLRLIKAALKSTFPNFTAAALNATQAAIDAAVAVVTGTAAHLFPLGSAAAPSITPIGDTDTGIYSAGANKLDFATNGVKAVEIDASQNVSMTAGANVAGALAVTGAITGPGAVPIGGTVLWWDDTLPSEGGWAWANGQVLTSANTLYPVLLARWGSKFGGNGITTMGLPDMREVSPVGKSTMGATTTPGRITNYVATTIGGFIGACLHVLTTGEMPTHTHNATDGGGHSHLLSGYYAGTQNNGAINGGGSQVAGLIGSPTTDVQHVAITNSTTGGGASHDNVSPGVVCNFIVRLG